MKEIAKHPLLELEYFEIGNESNLQPIENWEEAEKQVAFTAINISGVRLIDNMTINN